MPKGFLLLLIVAGFITAQPLDSQELPFAGFDRAQSLLHTIHRGLERFRAFWHAAGIPLLADDGGSDGGGSDGGGSDGGGGGSDGDGGDGTGNGAGDAASADDAATGSEADDAAASDDSSDLDADPTSVTVAPTTPTDPATEQNAVTPEIAAIEGIATTDPRGGFVPSNIPGTDLPGSAPGDAIGGESVDVAINAVIVSAAQSPWDAITKSLGVRNVIVTGGIIALGKTPIEGEIPGGGPQPAWLRLIPDLRLLNGSMIPPVVPNVIDIRILENPIEILNPPQGS
jgi:hypothetical protein